jgi:hypothetical protein
LRKNLFDSYLHRQSSPYSARWISPRSFTDLGFSDQPGEGGLWLVCDAYDWLMLCDGQATGLLLQRLEREGSGKNRHLKTCIVDAVCFSMLACSLSPGVAEENSWHSWLLGGEAWRGKRNYP